MQTLNGGSTVLQYSLCMMDSHKTNFEISLHFTYV
jgi:hypothetical protein